VTNVRSWRALLERKVIVRIECATQVIDRLVETAIHCLALGRGAGVLHLSLGGW
jgi:hypothetical protein